MPITVDVHKIKAPFPLERIRKAAQDFCHHLKISHAELSIILLSGPDIRRLNRAHLGHDYITDVVTFDLGQKGKVKRDKARRDKAKGKGFSSKEGMKLDQGPLSRFAFCSIDGEIYICPAEARRNARSHGESFEKELLRYVAHGILHLVGRDDQTDAQRQEMRAAEDSCLLCLSL